MKSTMTTFALALLCALALAACGGGNNNNGGNNTVLQVTAAASKANYALGEQVVIDVTIQNVSPNAVMLAKTDEALEIVSSTRDGAAFAPTTMGVKTERGLRTVVSDSLQTVAPGGSITIQLVSGHNGTSQVLALYGIVAGGAGPEDYEVKEYALGAAGSYSLELRYRNPLGTPAPAVSDTSAFATFAVAP